MTTFIEWLRVQLDEDERVALAASPGPWCVDPNDNEQVLAIDGIEVAAFALSSNQVRNTAIHIATFDPERVLAEVKAKRRILDEVVPRIDEMDSLIESEWGNGIGPVGESEQLIKLLAQPYAGREGWQDEWSVG